MAINQNYTFSLERQAGEFFDWNTFLITALLVAAGLISIYSATYDSGMSAYFFKQLIYTGMGFGVMIALMYIPERWIYANAYIIYGICILLLCVVLVPGIGKVTYGTRGWINLGGFSLQPSEFAKIGSLLAIAKYLSMKGTDVKTLRDLGMVVGFVALPALLIHFEPDDGSASVLGAMLFGLLLWTGFDIFILFFVVSLPIILILSLLGTVYLVISSVLFSIIAISFRRKAYITIGAIIIAVGVGFSSRSSSKSSSRTSSKGYRHFSSLTLTPGARAITLYIQFWP
jgi:rod shape determining protein RodA